MFQAHRGVYGSPRIHAALAEQGVHIGRKRVVRLMRQARLSAYCRTHRVVTGHPPTRRHRSRKRNEIPLLKKIKT